MPIVQISRIQHRRGRATDLPQLAAGELGWVIDEQRLFIGNGTVADGAPAVGNTEIITSGSSGFSAALNFIYKGYRQDGTILTGANVNTPTTRTLQERLDDYVSVKSFGAVGDNSTSNMSATTASIQRALDELYSDIVDEDDAQSRRILFFPAGIYRISNTLKIPPYAQLVGEGKGKSIILQASASGPVAQTVDNDGNEHLAIGTASATLPIKITCEGLTFQNSTGHGGVSLDCASHVKFADCEFIGSYAAGGSDSSSSKGVTVRSTDAETHYTNNILFDGCTFTKFARLVDLSYNSYNIRLINCDFSLARIGVFIGEQIDGSTNGLNLGPKNIQIAFSNFSDIYENGIKVFGFAPGANTGTGDVRNIVSFSNYFARTVGIANGTVDSIQTYPIINFIKGQECVSQLDFFDVEGNRSNSVEPLEYIHGSGIQTRAFKSTTLSDNTISGTTGIRVYLQAGKSLTMKYKISRGSSYRSGVFSVNVAGSSVSYNDSYEENSDLEVTLTADLADSDSDTNNDTIRILYTTSSTGNDAVLDYQITEML